MEGNRRAWRLAEEERRGLGGLAHASVLRDRGREGQDLHGVGAVRSEEYSNFGRGGLKPRHVCSRSILRSNSGWVAATAFLDTYLALGLALG